MKELLEEDKDAAEASALYKKTPAKMRAKSGA
jgi:hypothetical protein